MLEKYLKDIQSTKSRHGSEYSYRSDLRQLLKGLSITDEPTGKGKNKIDMEVYTPQGLVSFYIETKDIKEKLSHKKHQVQFERYKNAYSKLIITNFLDFEFYKDTVLIGKCSLADNKTFTPDNKAFDTFNTLLDTFMVDVIKFDNPSTLAKKLAENTRRLKDEILKTLNDDDLEIEQKIKTKKMYKLVAYRNEFKEKLIQDIDNTQFADLYAQTLTYGLFASRYYAYQKNPTAIFTKSEASNYIPKTNPLLKQFFEVTSSIKNGLSQNINNIIDSITTILSNTDMNKIISSLKNDIVIHFYESFLEQYDSELKKEMGVWYTPAEIVNYIVKGVDEILKSQFKIEDGLSSSQKQNYTYNKKIKIGEGLYKTETIVKENVHKVQILDPATGTGNFLNSVVSYIKNTFPHKSLWKSYVNDDLIPRLNGFELMMPSYVIAHMKMYELLRDSISEHTDRFNIYLTNTLNGAVENVDDQALITDSDLEYQLNEEALGANRVRQEQPVMVVLGNPPYNGNSNNKGEYILNLMKEYETPGENVGKGHNDDYIKFIRYAQNLVDHNKSGIIAYVSSNTFIKNISLYKMRESLLKSFDEIYILNLNGEDDENVFGITVPTCISFFIKTNNKDPLKEADVYYHELKGLKADKLSYCDTVSFKENFKKIQIIGDKKYFYPQDADTNKKYNSEAFGLDELFLEEQQGILTGCDSLAVDTSHAKLNSKIVKYQTSGWLPEDIENSKETKRSAKHHLKTLRNKNGYIKPSHPYKPFDSRFYFDSKIPLYPKKELVQHEQIPNNIYIGFTPCVRDTSDYAHIIITKNTPDVHFFKGKADIHAAPLYLNTPNPLDPSAPQFKSNLDTTITAKFTSLDSSITDLDIVDYIYGVLNNKAYTSEYNQFLRSDYPKVKFPDSIETFISYKEIGSKLRAIHLDDSTQDSQATYNATNNTIEKVSFSNNKLFFNQSDFFDNISQEMFDFKIGASQPLKNWLEARKGDSFDKPMLEQFMNVIYKVRSSLH